MAQERAITLTEKDARRLQAMLSWFERTGGNINAKKQRRGAVGSGTGTSTQSWFWALIDG